MAIVIHVNGYCSSATYKGPSASAFSIHDDKESRMFALQKLEKTANRAELAAAIAGLNALKAKQFVIIYSNLNYLVNGMTIFKANRLRKLPTEVANFDLWQQLDEAVKFHHNVQFKKPTSNNIYMKEVEIRAFEIANKIVSPL